MQQRVLRAAWGDVQIFIVSSEKIRLRGYETLYTYSISNPKSALARFVASVNPQWQVWAGQSAAPLSPGLHRLYPQPAGCIPGNCRVYCGGRDHLQHSEPLPSANMRIFTA